MIPRVGHTWILHSIGPRAAWVRDTRDWTRNWPWRISRLGRIIGYSLWQKKAISLSHSHWSANEKDCAVRRWTASSEVIWVILSSNSWAFWLCLSSALTHSCMAALRGGKKWLSFSLGKESQLYNPGTVHDTYIHSHKLTWRRTLYMMQTANYSCVMISSPNCALHTSITQMISALKIWWNISTRLLKYCNNYLWSIVQSGLEPWEGCTVNLWH